ncbi:MAG: DUF6088 family protein [Gammaproteobacteria bacterium]|nr:DUF6088 family protein [Gammaproteobacteria bacterium]
MQPVEKKIISRIYGRGRGWAFTKADFAPDFSEANIHQALSSLARAGTIRRVYRGVYDYPRYSELLGQILSPDMDQVAHALARKFNWRILPSGDAALNLLGLSSQVPGRWVYLSDGPNRLYDVRGTTLAFKKSALKDVGFQVRESGLLVQAIKALGPEHVNETVVEALRKRLDRNTCRRILKETRTVTTWVLQVIKRACREAN